MKTVPDLDRFLKDTLLENNRSQTLKLWALLEEERVEVEDGDEEASSTFHSIFSLFEQTTILLASQAFHRIEYQRRLNILSELIENSSQVTDLLKDHADILHCEENKLLIGEKFEEVLQKSSKTKKKSSEIFTKKSCIVIRSHETLSIRPPQVEVTEAVVMDRGISLPRSPKEASLCNNFINPRPQILLPQDFSKIHPLVQNLFAIKKFPQTLSRVWVLML